MFICISEKIGRTKVTTDVLERMDNLVAQAGTSNPYELTSYLNAYIGNITSPKLLAFVVCRSGIVCIGLNPHLPDHIKEVVLMHEVAHVAFHLDFLSRYGTFYSESSFFDSMKHSEIVQQEYEANLVAADFCLDTDDILDKLGYNLHSLQRYLEYLEDFKRHQAKYESFLSYTVFSADDKWTQKKLLNWKREMKTWEQELEDMQRNLTYEGNLMTPEEIAREYDIPVAIVEYKIEALRHRGYVTPNVELVSYAQVFK